MEATHHLKRALIAIIATLSLLFMQLAAATYTCAGISGAAGTAPVVMDMVPCNADASLGCEHLDATRTALCDVQAYASSEVTPELRLPKLSVIARAAWFTAFLVVPDKDAFRRPSLHPSPGLTRVISPSLSIRNCCYRI